MTVTGLMVSPEVFDRKKARGSYQADAVWKPIMVYSERMPWNDPQGVFSGFWWSIAAKVPGCFEFISYDLDALRGYLCVQQEEIHKVLEKAPKISKINYLDEKSDWHSYSFLKKLQFYYYHNGLNQSMRYGFQKLRGGNRA